MSEKDYAPLSIACVRGLCDKLYDKRKFAGAEIEKMVRDFSEAGNSTQIVRLIRVLGQDLMASTNPNVKNGALMGLSSVAVGLGKGVEPHALALMTPIAACLSEGESRVRYGAAEALFNVLKVCREGALPHLPLAFDALARLAADPEPQVRQAAELIDRLLKDIVTESRSVDCGALVRLVRERAYARGSGARQFAAGWVSALAAAPQLDLSPHLPDLLDPLFRMLDDPAPEIRRMVEVQLSEFLRQCSAPGSRAAVGPLLTIAATHALSPAPQVQLPALVWLRTLGARCPGALLARAEGALQAALPCLAHDDPNPPTSQIRLEAAAVNQLLMSLVSADTQAVESHGAESRGEESQGVEQALEKLSVEEALDVDAVVGVLVRLVGGGATSTQEAALEWLLLLQGGGGAAGGGAAGGGAAGGGAAGGGAAGGAVRRLAPTVFPAALHCLSLPQPAVVRKALAVLADICSADGELESSPYYEQLLKALLRLFAADEALMEDRGAFIIRQLCVLLGAERVYVALAGALRGERDGALQRACVDLLGTILLTAAELHDLRRQLRTEPASPLFRALYLCWVHSPVPLLALCLLTHNYAHCNRLIATFGDLEVTVSFLTEVDRLVQLIESPVFAYLRLELLGGDSSGLRRALYGLLMLLPQGEAFHTLRRRLQCAPQALPQPATAGTGPEDPGLEELLQEFVRVQALHRDQRLRGDHDR